MKLHTKQTRKGFTLVELLVVIAIIAGLAAMATPVIMKQKKKADLTTATNNAKQIFYLMIDFDGDFGEFPSEDSADDIQSDLDLGTESSNDFFRQFIAANYIDSEEIFFAKASFSKKPDNVVTTEGALEDGECGFAYLSGQSTSNNSSRPIAMAPMIDGLETFAPDPYDSKAVVLRIDGSVKQFRLNNEGRAILNGAQTLFDDGEDSIWGTDGFDTAALTHATNKN